MNNCLAKLVNFLWLPHFLKTLLKIGFLQNGYVTFGTSYQIKITKIIWKLYMSKGLSSMKGATIF